MDWVDRLRQAVDARGKHSAVAADAGVDPSVLSDILRRDTADPKLMTIVRICRVCGVSVGWVLGETGFDFGDADYEQLARLNAWSGRKLEERREGIPEAPTPISAKELPAVATPRGETWEDAEELRERDIPRDYRNEGANAVFRTVGDSMIEAGILEGDILFVRRSRNPRVANRQIVVCRIDGTFAVKRLLIERNTITLVSENRDQSPITINEEEERFSLIGIVVGVARDLFRRR